MPFGEDGCRIDEGTRKRLAALINGEQRPEQEIVLGRKLDDVRRLMEAEKQSAGDDDKVTRADVLRRVYLERYS